MIQVIAALQPLVIGAVLLWSAYGKLLDRRAADAARRSALVALLGERHAVPAYRLTGAAELLIGALLVLPPVLPAESAAAGALAVGFLGYLGYAQRTAPTSSCGCMGGKKHAPVTWRSFARAGLLLVGAGFAAVAADGYWTSAVADHPTGALVVVAAELAALVTLSPELDDTWLLPLRRVRVRLTHPLTGGYGVPLLASVQQLQLSSAYRRVSGLLSSDVNEHWEEDDWRMVCYAARYQGRPVTAVFAVPRLRHDPAAVRVALVDDASGLTLLSLDSTEAAGPDGSPVTLLDQPLGPAYA